MDVFSQILRRLLQDDESVDAQKILRQVQADQRKHILARSKRLGKRVTVERFDALAKLLTALVVVLEGKGLVQRQELLSVLSAIEIYDEDGDGKVDVDDLIARFPGLTTPTKPVRKPRRKRG